MLLLFFLGLDGFAQRVEVVSDCDELMFVLVSFRFPISSATILLSTDSTRSSTVLNSRNWSCFGNGMIKFFFSTKIHFFSRV